MKNLILIAIIFGAISCTKTTTPTTTTPTTTTKTDESVMKGTYNVTRTTYKDEALTVIDGSPSVSVVEVMFINNKYAIDFKATKDTVFLTNIKILSADHIAFDLETKTTKQGSVYESLKKYTTSGVAYSGRYKKGAKENLLLYMKTSNASVTRYFKIDGNK